MIAAFCFRAIDLLLLLDRRYTENPVCKMNVAVFSSSSLLPYSLVCAAGLLLATRFVLLSAEAGTSAVYVQ